MYILIWVNVNSCICKYNCVYTYPAQRVLIFTGFVLDKCVPAPLAMRAYCSALYAYMKA